MPRLTFLSPLRNPRATPVVSPPIAQHEAHTKHRPEVGAPSHPNAALAAAAQETKKQQPEPEPDDAVGVQPEKPKSVMDRIAEEMVSGDSRNLESSTESSEQEEKSQDGKGPSGETISDHRKELDALLSVIEDDPVAAIWAKFLRDMVDQKNTIDEFEATLGTEIYLDTFSNFAQVLEKSFDLLKAYIYARENPKLSGEDFKTKCKDLEVFSAFVANKELASKILRRKAMSLKDPMRIAQLEEVISSPPIVIKEFSDALKKHADEGFFSSTTEFDEAGAILQDVSDNIQKICTMLHDWSKTTENKYRKDFLSPAKRSLIYVDSTLNFPVLLFTDVLVIYSLEELRKGEEAHKLLHLFPLGLVEVEEKGKNTVFRAPTMDLEFQVTSPNNRAGNVLRRKVLDAKARLASQFSLGLNRIKNFPRDFPMINCCVSFQGRLILGTDEGLYLLDLTTPEKFLREIANCGKGIQQIELSENLQLIIFSALANDSVEIDIFTYPLLALDAFPAIQMHVHPQKVVTSNRVERFCSFDTERFSRTLLVSVDHSLQKYRQDRLTPFESKETLTLDDKVSFMQKHNGEVFCGTKKQIFRFTDNPMGNQQIFLNKDDVLPIDCLVLGKWHFVGFPEHGVVFNSEDKSTVSTLVWMESAHSFSLFGDFLLVFTDNFVEVRHRDRIWQVQQLIPSPKVAVLSKSEHYVFFDNQLCSIELLPKSP